MNNFVNNRMQHYAACSTFLVSLALVNSAWGSGFQLFEGNGVNAANFSAGISAGLFDASTASYNPAGLTDINRIQIVKAGTLVNTSSQYTGSARWSTSVPVTLSATETGTKNGGTANVVPGFHVAYPVNDHLVVALSATSPYGLATNNESQLHPFTFNSPASPRTDIRAVTRYSATHSSLKVIDVSPSLGYALNDRLSVGAGAHVQYANVIFNSMIGNPATAGTALDTESANSGTSWGWGYHAGLMYKLNRDLRFGVTYLSRVAHHFDGESHLTGPLANIANGGVNPIITSKNLKANTVLPDSVIFGGFARLSERFEVMGTVVFTHWSLLKGITLKNVAAVDTSTGVPLQTSPATVTAPQNFKNTWRFMGGVNYHYNDMITLMAGAGYDQTPTNNTDRSVRLPDGNRLAVAAGAHFNYSDDLSFDVGWTHIFIKTVDIKTDLATGSQRVEMNGRSKNHADLVGLQMNYSLGHAPAKLMPNKFGG